ncbi:MAG: DUF2851 family protein [bacterium]|nr:MAG: DUF2851 family protein [bacterium]
MKVDDRSAIAEYLIYQLWEQNYFSSIPLETIEGQKVTIISTGIRNKDSGPDFRNISIKMDEKIYQGDLEIHRAPEDWYLHNHHADPAYNNVVMHLVIGPEKFKEPAIRLDREPVPVQVFVDIAEDEYTLLTKMYRLTPSERLSDSICLLRDKNEDFKTAVIDYFSRERLQAKADRFTEQRETNSWNQIVYIGIMEALGYSKNQIPFRKLAQQIPFEALMREFYGITKNESLYRPLGLLMGAAGLLPSQDSYFDWRKIKDQETQTYVSQLEDVWAEYSTRLGLKPMQQQEWHFFRLRPSNFPTRRLAGASLILQQFVKEGILDKILKIIEGLKDNHLQLIKELEKLFTCQTGGYWATHYRVEEKAPELINEKSATLVGKERARDIVINIVLPVVLAYAAEIEDSLLRINILQLYQAYPKVSSNSIIKKMSKQLFGDIKGTSQFINTAARQQGLIHLYKLYCHRGECERCQSEWENE